VIVVVAVLVGILFASGTFLILQRTLTRVILGLTMCANGVNMVMLLAGGRAGSPAFADGSTAAGSMVDPMPQAMALTAIVINFAMVAFLLALAYRSATLTGVDEVEDDLEDLRIAATIREEELAAEVEEEEVADMPPSSPGGAA
jgi:multicomponent Na+:H+ antiporter subunit C